ncbi:MAG: HNH endonuclease [Methanomicrobiaceae archaeon]|uniref:HNH nuclease domain-containing protein n=1 Tax=hydrocarbon metagenome TaxID=938273 RepID=A0A0W8FJS9_9ZZZZ|nr:HNH endonuclease [Methanomicrobiaceae archaeon]MDD5418931.1 HNH endonuclease signature motif containing protein [Methanomicrobiaceae archaeon]
MTVDIQLTLDTFAEDGEPLCNRKPLLNGFKELCYHCSRSARQDGDLICTEFASAIRSWDKYSLKEWKAMRRQILARDGHRCALCGASEGLHVHHINQIKTDDSPDNLLTLCGFCHARIHTELRQPEGQMRVERVIAFIRSGGESGG